MWQNKIKGRIVQKHSVNGIGKFQAEILIETDNMAEQQERLKRYLELMNKGEKKDDN